MDYFLGIGSDDTIYPVYNDLLNTYDLRNNNDTLNEDLEFQYCPKCKTWTFLSCCEGPIHRICCDYGEKYWYFYCSMCDHYFFTDIAPYKGYDEETAIKTQNDIIDHMNEIGNPKCLQQKIITNHQERKNVIQYLLNYLEFENEEDKQLFIQKFSKLHIYKTQLLKINKIVTPILFDIVREPNVNDTQMKEFIDDYIKYYQMNTNEKDISVPDNIYTGYKNNYQLNTSTVQKMNLLYPNVKIEPCIFLNDNYDIPIQDKQPIFNRSRISQTENGIYGFLHPNQIYIEHDDFFFDTDYFLPVSFIEVENMYQEREWTLISGD